MMLYKAGYHLVYIPTNNVISGSIKWYLGSLGIDKTHLIFSYVYL